jgi:hypothetical protein
MNVQRIKFKKYDSFDDEEESLWLTMRHGLDDFISWCDDQFTWCIWSTGKPDYVRKVVDLLPRKPKIIMDWTSCERRNYKVFKPIKRIMEKHGISEENIVMVDDTKEMGVDNPENFLHFPKFNKNKIDGGLYELRKALKYAKRSGDMRRVKSYVCESYKDLM